MPHQLKSHDVICYYGFSFECNATLYSCLFEIYNDSNDWGWCSGTSPLSPFMAHFTCFIAMSRYWSFWFWMSSCNHLQWKYIYSLCCCCRKFSSTKGDVLEHLPSVQGSCHKLMYASFYRCACHLTLDVIFILSVMYYDIPSCVLAADIYIFDCRVTFWNLSPQSLSYCCCVSNLLQVDIYHSRRAIVFVSFIMFIAICGF